MSVSVYATGVVRLSPRAWAAIGRPRRVVFLHDRKAPGVVGIRRADDGDPDAYAAVPVAGGAHVSGAAFFGWIGRTPDQAARHPARLVDGDLVWSLDHQRV